MIPFFPKWFDMAYGKVQTHIYMQVHVVNKGEKDLEAHRKSWAVPQGHFTLTEKYKHSVFIRETKDRFLLSCSSIFSVLFFGISLPLEISG